MNAVHVSPMQSIVIIQGTEMTEGVPGLPLARDERWRWGQQNTTHMKRVGAAVGFAARTYYSPFRGEKDNKGVTYMENVGLELQHHVRHERRIFALEPGDLHNGIALYVRNHLRSKGRRHVAHQFLLVERDPVVFAV